MNSTCSGCESARTLALTLLGFSCSFGVFFFSNRMHTDIHAHRPELKEVKHSEYKETDVLPYLSTELNHQRY